jgi:hypothetical protein
MIFTYAVTALLIAVSISVLGKEFPLAPLYILISFLGLGVSFWQQKKQPVPYLRALANCIFLFLTVQALLPFFSPAPKQDIFTALLKTWIYFLVISAFVICKKRDFYITQGLSLGLVIYACFYAVHNPLVLFNASVCFLGVWMMGLRALNLLPEGKKQAGAVSGIENIWREVKAGLILFLAVFVIAVPFYFLIPRINIPLLPLNSLLQQRYSAIYADFPKRGLVAFLSRAPQKMTPEKNAEGKTPAPSEEGTKPYLETSPEKTKPVFWESRALAMLKEIEKTNQQLRDTKQQIDPAKIEKELAAQQKHEEALNRDSEEIKKALAQAEEHHKNLVEDASAARQEGQSEETVKYREEMAQATAMQIEKLKEESKAAEARAEKAREKTAELKKQLAAAQEPEVQALRDKKAGLSKELVALIKEEQKEVPTNQEIQDLTKAIEKTNQELRDLNQQNNLVGIEKDMREWETRKAEKEMFVLAEEKLNERVTKMKEGYLNLSGEATKQPEEELKIAEERIKQMIEVRQALEARLQETREKMEEIRKAVREEAQESRQPMVQVLWEKKEAQEKELETLVEKVKMIPPEERKLPPEVKPKKTESQSRAGIKRRASILDAILYALILIAGSYAARLIMVIFVPVIRQRRRIKSAMRSQEHNLAISLTYNFLCLLFSFFGYKYPVQILPEEYFTLVKDHFAHNAHDLEMLTALFIEARYSAHPLSARQQEEALNCYRVILEELKHRGAFWQRQIFKAGFLFSV